MGQLNITSEVNVISEFIAGMIYTNDCKYIDGELRKIIFDLTPVKQMYDLTVSGTNDKRTLDIYFRVFIEWLIVGYTDDPANFYLIENICSYIESDIINIVDEVPNIGNCAIYMERAEVDLLLNISNMIKNILHKIAPSGDVLPYSWKFGGSRTSLTLLYNSDLNLDVINY